MSVLSILLSIFCSTLVVLIYRQLDKKNRSFEKIAKLSKSIKNELSVFANERLQQLKDYDNSIDVSFQKGQSILTDLNQSVSLLEQKTALINQSQERISTFFQKIDMVDKEILELNHQVQDLHEGREYIKSVDDKFNKFKKQMAFIERDIGRIEDNFKKENMGALKNISGTVMKEMDEEVKELKKELSITKKEINSRREEMIKTIKESGGELREDLKQTQIKLVEFTEQQHKLLMENTTVFKQELTGIESAITTMKTDFFKQVETEFYNLNQVLENRMEEKNAELNRLELDFQKKLEDKITDYSAYITRIESRGETLSHEIQAVLEDNKQRHVLDIKASYTELSKDLQTFSEKLKLNVINNVTKAMKDIEAKYKSSLTHFKDIEKELDEKSLGFENFIKDTSLHMEKIKNNITVDVKEKIEEFDLHIKNTRDLGLALELEIFDKIKSELETFKTNLNGDITVIKEDILGNTKLFEDEINVRYTDSKNLIGNISIGLTELRKNLDHTTSDFNGAFLVLTEKQKELETHLNQKSDELKKHYTEDMEKYKKILISNIMKMKEYLESEKTRIYSDVDKSLAEMTKASDNKTTEISNKFEKTYKQVEGRLLGIQDEIAKKATKMEKDILDQQKSTETNLATQFARTKEELFKLLKNHEAEKQVIENDIRMKLDSFMEKLDGTLLENSNLAEEKISELNTRLIAYEKTIQETVGVFDKKFADNDQLLNDKISFYEKKINHSLEASTLQITAINQEITEHKNDAKQNLESFIHELDQTGRTAVGNLERITQQLNQQSGDLETKLFSELNQRYAENKNKLESWQTSINQIVQNAEKLKEKTFNSINQTVKDLENELHEEVNNRYQVHQAELAGHVKKINDYTAQIEQMKDEAINNLKTIADGVEERIFSDLNEKYKSHKDEVDSLKKIIEDYQQQIINFKETSIRQLDHVAEEQNDKIKLIEEKLFLEIKNKYSFHKDELDDLENNIGDIVKEVNSYKSDRFNELNKTAQELEEKLFTELNQRYQTNKDALDNAQDGLMDYLKEIDTLKSNSFESVNQTILDLENKLTQEVYNRYNHHKEAFSDESSQIDDFIKQIDQLKSAAVSNLQQITKGIEEKVFNDVNEKYFTHQKEIISIKNMIEDYRLKIADFKDSSEQQLEKLGEEINFKADEVEVKLFEELNHKYALHKNELEEQEEKFFNEINQNYLIHKTAIENVQKQINDYNQEISRSKAVNTEKLIQMSETLDLSTKELENKLFMEINNKYSFHKDELDDLETRISTIVKEVDSYKNRSFASLNSSTKELETKLNSEISGRYRQYQEELQQIQQTVHSYRKEVETLKESTFNNFNQQTKELENRLFEEINGRYYQHADMMADHIKKINDTNEQIENLKETALGNLKNIAGGIEDKLFDEINNNYLGHKTVLENIQKQINDSNQEIIRLKELNEEKLNQTSETLDLSIKKTEEKLFAELTNKYTFHKDELADLETNIGTILKEVEVYKNRSFTAMNNSTKELEEKLNTEINTRYQQYQDALKKIHQTILAYNKEIDVLKNNTFSNFNQHTEELENKLFGEINSRYQNHQDELSQIKEKYNSIQIEIDNYKDNAVKKIDQLSGEIEEKAFTEINTRYTDHQNALSLLQTRVDQYAVLVDDLKKNALEHLTLAEDELEKKLFAGVNEKFQQYKNELAMINTEITGYTKQMQEFKKQIHDQLNQTTHELENQMVADVNKRYQSQKDALDAQINELKNHITANIKNNDEMIAQTQNASLQSVKEMQEKFKLLVKDWQQKVVEMIKVKNEEINEFKNKTSLSINKINDEIKADEDKYHKLNEKINHYEKEMDKSLAVVGNRLKTNEKEIDKYKEEITFKINGYYADIKGLKDESQQHLNQISQELEQNLLKEINNRYEVYKNELNELNETLKSTVEKSINESSLLITSNRQETENGINGLKNTFTTGIKEWQSKVIEMINAKNQDINLHKDKAVADITQLNEQFKLKLAEQNKNLEDRFQQIYTKADQLESGLEKRVKDVEKVYHDKSEKLVQDNNIRLETMSKKFIDLSDQLSKLKTKLDSEIVKKIDDSRLQLNELFKNGTLSLQENYKKLEQETIENISIYKKEMLKIQQNMKQIDDRFTARFLEHANLLDKKIENIDAEIIKFEKGTKLFERTDELKQKLADEVKSIKDEIVEIKKDRNEILKVEKKIMAIESIANTTQDKFKNILDEKKKIENIESMLTELNEISENVDSKIDNIKTGKVMIQGIEDKISQVNEQMIVLEKYYQSIIDREESVTQSLKSVTNLQNLSQELIGKYQNLQKQYDDLEFKKTTYEKSFKNFEKDANLITKSEKKVMEVVDKFQQMDSLIDDLEVRTDVINKHREWLVKAETQIVNLNSETDKKIKLLESLLNTSSQSPLIKNKLSDDHSKKDTVLKLKKQGWTIDEISKTLNLSLGEVEFILDLEHGKISKH